MRDRRVESAVVGLVFVLFGCAESPSGSLYGPVAAPDGGGSNVPTVPIDSSTPVTPAYDAGNTPVTPYDGGVAPTDPCDSCAVSRCATTWSACSNDAQCLQLFECGRSCDPSDSACFQACDTTYSGGVAALDAHFTCVGQSCAVECGDGSTAAGDACETCGMNACPTQYATCGRNPECLALGDCYWSCTDEACYTTCETTHASGVADSYAYEECLYGACATECGGPAS